MAQRVKPPLAMPVARVSVNSSPDCFTSEQENVAQALGELPLMWNTLMEFLHSGSILT